MFRKLIAASTLALALGVGGVVIPGSAQAATDNTAQWESGAPSCVNPADSEWEIVHLTDTRACYTGSVRLFHATTHPTVWLDVKVKQWTYDRGWHSAIDTDVRYKATCGNVNLATLNIDNGDCVAINQSWTDWHTGYLCGDVAGMRVCGDIWPNARTDFEMQPNSTYSVTHTASWWNGSIRKWQNQTYTYWLNPQGRVYASSVSAIQTPPQ